MSNDSKSSVYAQVDVALARFNKGDNLGIEFTTEIDIWAQMHFRARQQIQHLKNGSTPPYVKARTDIRSLFYKTQQGLE